MKAISILLAGLLVLYGCVKLDQIYSKEKLGDANNDGKVDIYDYVAEEKNPIVYTNLKSIFHQHGMSIHPAVFSVIEVPLNETTLVDKIIIRSGTLKSYDLEYWRSDQMGWKLLDQVRSEKPIFVHQKSVRTDKLRIKIRKTTKDALGSYSSSRYDRDQYLLTSHTKVGEGTNPYIDNPPQGEYRLEGRIPKDLPSLYPNEDAINKKITIKRPATIDIAIVPVEGK